MPESVAERRRKVLVGELPPDFLRLAMPGPAPVQGQGQPVDPALAAAAAQSAQASTAIQAAQNYAMYGFIPPNTRGRLSITIHEANLVKNYGLVKMDPYCRIRVGHTGFETQTQLSGGRNPAWNRTIHAYLPVGVDSIYVQIFDERAFSSDELIAWAHILLPETIFNGDAVDDYYQLSGQQGENKEGMLHLTFSFAPIEQPVQPQTVAGATANPVAARQPIQITEEDMKEFADMFPMIDKEVIKCVLEERRGNKEATVTALLEMTQ